MNVEAWSIPVFYQDVKKNTRTVNFKFNLEIKSMKNKIKQIP